MNPGQPLAQTGQATVSRAVVNAVQSALRVPVGAAFSATALADPTVLPLDRFNDLLDACARHDGPDCGLRMGAQASPATFSVLGYLAMSSRTLGEAMALMPRYDSLVMSLGMTTLFRVDDQVQLNWALRGEPAHPVLEDFILAAWLKLGRWLVGRELVARAVCLSRPAPTHDAAYRQYFGCPIEFGCAHASVHFPAGWLAMPVLHADPELHALMLERAQAIEPHQAAVGPWRQQVLTLLPDLLPSQRASMVVVAERLGMAERSLRRRLAQEGCCFQSLLQTQRQELARHYLQDERLGLIDIALLLGYSEHSAFSTAFRQWFGVTPQQYRAEYKNTHASAPSALRANVPPGR